MAVDVQGPATGEVERGERVQIFLVPAANNGALATFGMMNDREDVRTFRGWTEIPYFSAMSRNMRPNQSSARVVMRSGAIDNLAQQKAAVTALPPNEIAYEEATCFSSPTGNRSVRNVTSI